MARCFPVAAFLFYFYRKFLMVGTNIRIPPGCKSVAHHLEATGVQDFIDLAPIRFRQVDSEVKLSDVKLKFWNAKLNQSGSGLTAKYAVRRISIDRCSWNLRSID